MTARNFLSDRGIGTGTNHTVSGISSLMDDYAQQKAIEFADWLAENEYELEKRGWNNGMYEGHTYFSTDELFTKFQNENK